jgi:transcriptional regulator with XRE-family HTH domain
MAKRAKTKADLKAIGARVRELRGVMLQEELAVYLGISQGQLSKIERGRMAPTVETLLRLSEKFEKSVDWILRGGGSDLLRALLAQKNAEH